MVADGEDGERRPTEARGKGVEGARLHLQGQYAKRLKDVSRVGRVVKRVHGGDAADVYSHGFRPRCGYGGGEQRIVRGGCEIEITSGASIHAGVGGSSQRDDDVAQGCGAQSACCANANRALYAVIAEELVGVDGQRRRTHASALHRDPVPANGARETQHVANARVLHRVVEKLMCDPLCAQGISWQQYGVRDLTRGRGDVDTHATGRYGITPESVGSASANLGSTNGGGSGSSASAPISSRCTHGSPARARTWPTICCAMRW